MKQEVKQRIAVYGFVVDEENKFLLLRRGKHDSMPGIWEIPGGALEFGETLEEAVVREVREEAGIDIETVSLVTCIAKSSQTSDGIHKQTIRIAYHCHLVNPTQQVTVSKEHDRFQWASLSSLPDVPLSDFLQEVIQALDEEEYDEGEEIL